jgi:hypothetical protein
MPIILASWEAEIRRLEARGQPRQKVSETSSELISWVWVHACDPSYTGGHMYDYSLKLALGKNTRTYLKND